MNHQFKNFQKLILPAIFACAFFALAGEARAATYYVSTSGNDNNTGLSPVQAWKTTGKVNSSVTGSGDIVLFKCGDTWKGADLTPLVVDWPGTSINRAIVGAYYGAGVRVRADNMTSAGALPKFDGELTWGATAEDWTCVRPTSAPSTSDLIKTTSDYTTFEFLHVTRSGGSSIRTNADHCTVSRCRVDYGFYTGIGPSIAISDLRIEFCTTDLTPCQRLYYALLTPKVDRYGSPIAVGMTTNAYVGYNDVRRSHGEGIGIGKGTTNCLIEYNRVSVARSTMVYMDRGVSYSTAKNNLVVCEKYPTEANIWNSSNECGTGIVSNDESLVQGNSHDNYFFGNLVFNASRGMSFADDEFRGLKFFNNTIVNSREDNLWFNNVSTFTTTLSEIKNNIFICTNDSGVCRQTNAYLTPKGSFLQLDYNLFYSGGSQAIDSDARGTNDIIATSFPSLYKTTGWTLAQSPAQTYSGIDFSLKSLSPAINAGVNLGDTYDEILSAKGSNFLTGCGLYGTGETAFSVIDQDSHGAWEIGADVFVSGETTPPAKPSGLSVR